MRISKITETFRESVRQIIFEEQDQLEATEEQAQEEYEENLKRLDTLPTAPIGQLFSILGQLGFDGPSAISLFISSFLTDPEEINQIEAKAIPSHWDT